MLYSPFLNSLGSRFTFIRCYLTQFWKIHPALFFSTHLVLGCSLYFYSHWAILSALPFIWLPFFGKNIKSVVFILLCSFLIGGAWEYSSLVFATKKLAREKMEGVGRFHIKRVKKHATPFNHFYLYEGTLRSFRSGDHLLYYNLPCKLSLPIQSVRPSANKDYWIHGCLIDNDTGFFTLKPDNQTSWSSVKSSSSLAEWRFQTKEWFKTDLKTYVKNPRSHAFFCALITADLDDRNLYLEFGRLGLLHLLAISGFHFGLLTLLLHFLFKLFLPPRATAFACMIVLSFYFFWLGGGPSVCRAWVALSIFLLGRVLNKRCSAINALGCGLIIELLVNPFSIKHLGFQLSFLCTFGIITLYPLFNSLLNPLFKLRAKSIILKMNLINQHGHLLSSMMRKLLALNCSVHCFAIPVLLFYFHKFPVLGLIYNLFTPFLASISYFLLWTALFAQAIFPPLGHALHHVNDLFSNFWLELIASPPACFHFIVRLKYFPLPMLILCLFPMVLLGIILKGRRNLKFH